MNVLFTDYSFVARGSARSRMNQTTRNVPAAKTSEVQSSPKRSAVEATVSSKAIVGRDPLVASARELIRKTTLSRNLPRPQASSNPWIKSIPGKNTAAVASGLNPWRAKAPEGAAGIALRANSRHRKTKVGGRTVHVLQAPMRRGGPFVADLFQLSFS